MVENTASAGEQASLPEWEPWVRAIVWNGENGSRCPAHDDAEHGCDLLSNHGGPHFYVLDHDDEGDPSWIATWPSGPTAARCDGINCRNEDHYDGAGNHDEPARTASFSSPPGTPNGGEG